MLIPASRPVNRGETFSDPVRWADGFWLVEQYRLAVTRGD